MPSLNAQDEFEFALLPERAAESGIAPHTAPSVARRFITTATGDRVSAVCWTAQTAEVVLLHRECRDARSLDRIALALGRPAVAIDLPGHGRSDTPTSLPAGNQLGDAIAALAPHASAIVALNSGALHALDSLNPATLNIDTLVLVDTIPTPTPNADTDLFSTLSKTASSYLIRSLNGPISSSDINQLRRSAPSIRLLQLSIGPEELETTGAPILANAVRAVLNNSHFRH